MTEPFKTSGDLAPCWKNLFETYKSLSKNTAEEADYFIDNINGGDDVYDVDVVSYFDSDDSGYLSLNDVFTSDEEAFQDIVGLSLATFPSVLAQDIIDALEAIQTGALSYTDLMNRQGVENTCVAQMSCMNESIPSSSVFEEDLEKIDFSHLDGYTDLEECLKSQKQTKETNARCLVAFQQFVRAYYHESKLDLYRQTALGASERDFLNTAMSRCDDLSLVFAARVVKSLCGILHCSEMRINGQTYQLLGETLVQIGENKAAQFQFFAAAERSETQSQQMFNELMALSQLDDKELVAHERQLHDLLYYRIPVFEKVILEWQEREDSVERVSKGLEDLFARGTVTEFDQEFDSQLSVFAEEHRKDLDIISGTAPQVPKEGTDTFVEKMREKHYRDEIFLDARIPGSLSEVRSSWALCWELLMRTRLAKEKQEKKKLDELQSTLLNEIQRRYTATGGQMPPQESLELLYDLSQSLVYMTDRFSFIENEATRGGQKKAEDAIQRYRLARTQLTQNLTQTSAREAQHELVSHVDLLLQFDARMASHQYALALENLQRVVDANPTSKVVAHRMKLLAKMYPHLFDGNGKLLDNVNFSDTDIGRDAAAREELVFEQSGGLTSGTLYGLGGTFLGVAGGCLIGGLLGGTAGSVAPGPGTVGGGLGGCSWGASVLGGVTGAVAGEAVYQETSQRHHTDQLDASARTGLSVITDDEYRFSRKFGYLSYGVAGLTGGLFTGPGRMVYGLVRVGVEESATRIAQKGGFIAISRSMAQSTGRGALGVVRDPSLIASGLGRSLTWGSANLARGAAYMQKGMTWGGVRRFFVGSPKYYAQLSEEQLGTGMLHRLGMRVAAQSGLVVNQEVGGTLRFAGWWAGLKNMTDATLHSAERASLPYVLGETALRQRDDDTDARLSSAGGIALMFAMNRIAYRLGLDKNGQRVVVILDRVSEAYVQYASGQPWQDIDFSRLAVNYGTGTIVGQWRGKLLRDWLSRYSTELVKDVTIKMGDQKTSKLVLACMDQQEQGLIKKLLRNANHQNVVWLTPEGQIMRGVRTVSVGEGATMTSRQSLKTAEEVARLTEEEQQILLRWMRASGAVSSPSTTFHSMVAGASRKNARALKLSQDFNLQGLAAFCIIHDTLVGTAWDGFRGEYLLEGDGRQIAEWTFTRSYTTLPFRNAWKLAFGWDRPMAIFGDRIIGREMLDPILAKFYPHYSSKGFWEKRYAQDALPGSLDDFLDYHTAPGVMQGGLDAWKNERVLNPIVHQDGKIISVGGESQFEPLAAAYARLADFYSGSKMSDKDLAQLDVDVDNLISEAKQRLEGWATSVPSTEKSRYDDATIVEHALAIGLAAHFAAQKNPQRFPKTFAHHSDWFDFIKSSGLAREYFRKDHPSSEEVRAFVEDMVARQTWQDMNRCSTTDDSAYCFSRSQPDLLSELISHQ